MSHFFVLILFYFIRFTFSYIFSCLPHSNNFYLTYTLCLSKISLQPFPLFLSPFPSIISLIFFFGKIAAMFCVITSCVSLFFTRLFLSLCLVFFRLYLVVSLFCEQLFPPSYSHYAIAAGAI